MEELKQKIDHALKRMTLEGGDDNRFILQGDQGFLIISCAKGAESVWVRAAAGRALPQPLTQEATQTLYERGFRRKTAASLFECVYMISSPKEREELTSSLIFILNQIYLSSPAHLSLKLSFGQRESLKNPNLISAIKKLAKERDMSSRQKLYWSFLKAELMLILDAPPPKDLSNLMTLQLKKFNELTQYDSVAVFSDWDNLQTYDARGADYIRLSGRLIVSLLVNKKVNSVLINPYNSIGGEFYQNELISMDEAIKRFEGQH